jgi:glutaredoxin
MIEITLYTRAGCHLCDEAKQVLQDAQAIFQEVDIDTDLDLRARFNEEVPVVFVAGKKAFKYRVDPAELRRKLQRASPSIP